MQLLTRRVLLNLTKNSIKTPKVPATGVALNLQKKNDAFLQNYSTESKKQKLLRFPAFPLTETLTKFLKTTEPLLNEQEMQATKEAVDYFRRQDGEKLQKLLEACAEKEQNWLASRWLRTAYMQYRDPVTVFSSPGMSFPIQQAFKSDEDYVKYAAKMIYGLVSYKQKIDNNEIPVVKMGKFELDNSQFERVFGTCRIPKQAEDFLEYYPQSKHVVVIYKNHFYKLPVYNKNSEPLHPDVLAQQMLQILKTEKSKGTGFGILSTAPRDDWANAYEELLKSSSNKNSIKVIQAALFTVSLDDHVPTGKDTQFTVLSEQLIHGGGAQHNSGNRWMDKTIQVIVNRNGMSGFTYEHSPAEGQPIALMVDYVLKNIINANEEEFAKTTARQNYDCIEKLKFDEPNACLEQQLVAAQSAVNRLAKDLDCVVLHYKGYGKEFLKQQKLSPDSFIQIAIQYAFYKLHLLPGAHYESAHLRIYTGGRTETIRSCSNESIAFAKAMLSSSVADAERVELLRKAVNGHREYTNMALQGQGVDRHLLGLKLMALEHKLPVPEFYKSPGYIKSAHFRLSTSQVASAYEAYMCYGPLTHDGYGCCYNPRPNDIMLALSAWRSNNETNVNRFAVALREAFTSMQDLLERAGEKPKAKL